MLTLKEVIQTDIETEQILLEKREDMHHVTMILRSINERRGVYHFFEEGDIEKAKQDFYVCSLLDAFKILKYGDRMFDYSIPSMGFALLSDNTDFLKQVYANLSYQTTYLDNDPRKEIPINMNEMALSGEGAIFCHTIQQFIKNDKEAIERNLNIIETISLPPKTEGPDIMKLDFEFYKALHAKDKSKCEDVLDQLVSPKIHDKRSSDLLLKKYVSQPALGYAKLAWLNGVEVEVDNPLIPKEFLPIKPNASYHMKYDFFE